LYCQTLRRSTGRANVQSRQRSPADEASGIFGEEAEGISNVSFNIVEQGSVAIGADAFLRLFDPAKQLGICGRWLSARAV
jgi:hypothetical protein